MRLAGIHHRQENAAEFCENGAKAIAEENTTRTVTPEFWAAHSIAELATKTDHWLGNQGRITEPVVISAGGHPLLAHQLDGRLRDLAAEHIRATTPERCVFYTSGRTANETAFMFQLFAR